MKQNADPDKYEYSGYKIGFDSCSQYFGADRNNEKNVIIFGVDNSSSVHIDNRNKNNLVLGEESTKVLEGAIITAEAKYLINFTESEKKILLSLHYNGSNSFLFVNSVKIYQFKAKDSEIKPYPLCLGNISKDFSLDNMKKTGLEGNVEAFSVDYDSINSSDIRYPSIFNDENIT